ncbi:MAG: hypothetical protein MI924_33810 [Chloroflexales bacterium]|nr:hypothetical protein [Chloroflexales bacterium]
MYQKEYFVPKRSGTLADPLLAYGVATVLHAIITYAPRQRANQFYRVSIVDSGAYYTIQLPESIREEWAEQSQMPHDLARPVLRVPKPKETAENTPKKPKPKKQPLPESAKPIDYNKVWDSIHKVNALIAAQRQTGRRIREEIAELRASNEDEYLDRDVALLIGDYRMQVEGIHNQAVRQWVQTLEAGHQAANVRAILSMFTTPDADWSAVAKAWAKEVKIKGVKPRLTASQVFNPSMGKGQNQPKANQLAINNENIYWLLEYLKAVGLFVAAVPRAFTDEGMRKTYVLAPADIELGRHQNIFKDFKHTLDGASISPIKADVLTSLGYAAAYLSYCREAKITDPDADVDFTARNTVQGFAVAGYVLLSQNSFTMINLSSLGLPPWLNDTVKTSDAAAAVQTVIEEHQTIIRPLNEKFQEQYMLLDTYRDFLARRSEALFAFCGSYGEYVVHTIPENPRIRQMSVPALDQIIERINLRRIDMVEVDPFDFVSTSGRHPGFHNIAYAIRHSTVIPQRQLARFKAKEKGTHKPLYEVRYGLGNNLRRKTASVSEFMGALAEFLQVYNAETDQVYENTSDDRKDNQEFGRGRYRSPVAVSDLDDVFTLIKACNNDVVLVCNMLVAYGYAATKSRQEKAASGSSEEDIGNDNSDERMDNL